MIDFHESRLAVETNNQHEDKEDKGTDEKCGNDDPNRNNKRKSSGDGGDDNGDKRRKRDDSQDDNNEWVQQSLMRPAKLQLNLSSFLCFLSINDLRYICNRF